ncbi:unnamed protein product [Medioppia subpectinata]|uniref:Uncharacterized protein n=1 Tax=Medioppia subpectinata TaxID=1979941 RepID=A0A7R9QBA1_9ACAR|nr:unnamed protein product [Medioppia subpectinata]CAG2117415.1 unnamed protein product [Medioppia subpectinata]
MYLYSTLAALLLAIIYVSAEELTVGTDGTDIKVDNKVPNPAFVGHRLTFNANTEGRKNGLKILSDLLKKRIGLVKVNATEPHIKVNTDIEAVKPETRSYCGGYDDYCYQPDYYCY